MNCIGQPISWPTLERYHLMELPPSKAKEVAEHLKVCPVCAACAAVIEQDSRCLPALGSVADVPVFGRFRRLGFASVAVGFGIALLLAVMRIFAPDKEETESGLEGIQYKGGSPSFTLIRERSGQTVENPDRYTPRDRFRMTVTLPSNLQGDFDVVVFQDGAVYFPYERQRSWGPSNLRPLQGTFRINGQAPTEICLLSGPSLPSRERLRAEGRRALPREPVCRTLTASSVEIK